MDHSRLPGNMGRIDASASRKLLGEVAQWVRSLHWAGDVAPLWPLSKFEQIEHTAAAILSSPPADLTAIAMDSVRMVRLLLGVDVTVFADAFEEVGNRPEWRVPYMSYLIPFLLSVVEDWLGRAPERATPLGCPA